ncbi:MAG: RNA polymerase sigma factor [Solirubrobacteraceae bacterium]
MWTTDTQTALAPPVVGGVPRRRLSLAGDERLAHLVRHGNEEAFAALYERYHQRLYRYCRSMLHNDADAQDALQSTFAGSTRPSPTAGATRRYARGCTGSPTTSRSRCCVAGARRRRS